MSARQIAVNVTETKAGQILPEYLAPSTESLPTGAPPEDGEDNAARWSPRATIALSVGVALLLWGLIAWGSAALH
jgi:hypothetical protein